VSGYLATTRGAVLRGGTAVDALGDDVADDAVVPGMTDFPLGLTERSRTVFDQSTGTPRTIRVVTGRVPAHFQLEDGDVIRDNRTGKLYAIDEKTDTPRGIAGAASLTLTLRLTR
jgi:hypothetical protein